MSAADQIFAMLRESSRSGAPLYLQLRRSIEEAVNRGLIGPGDALPSERDIASKADISRVTVRKAVQDLVKGGLLVQRMIDRIEHGKAAIGLVHLPHLGQRDHESCRGMGILAAVFAHTGRIGLDVAGVLVRF